jgi:UDP-GlcNAc:undecaprenyl-phosphate GlcNAc-1-phosphate transferase
MSAGRRLIAAAASGVTATGAARLAYAALNRVPPGGTKTWSRTNHRGEPVTLLEGPAGGGRAGARARLAVRRRDGGRRGGSGGVRGL